MVTFAKALQFLTELGIVTLAKEEQFKKASKPMRVAESGMATFAKELQLAKASFPMRVTELDSYIC